MAELLSINSYEQFSKNGYNFTEYLMIENYTIYTPHKPPIGSKRHLYMCAIKVGEVYHILELNDKYNLENEIKEYINQL